MNKDDHAEYELTIENMSNKAKVSVFYRYSEFKEFGNFISLFFHPVQSASFKLPVTVE